MKNFETSLRNLTIAPYIVKATALIGIQRKSGSNMFRHQISTFGILLDYKITDPVVLKAALIHDLFEDAGNMPGVTEDEIKKLDADGPAVYDLVMEVSIRRIPGGGKEPKSEFLLRIMKSNNMRAKVLKLADRISNVESLGFVHDLIFVKKYIQETKDLILPFAQSINADMYKELFDLVENRSKMIIGM
ncbi:MAG: HD domain-containing protein [Saprospiraceae bacterium]